MSRQIELLDKFYDNKATESEKRQLAGLLNDPDRWPIISVLLWMIGTAPNVRTR